MKNFPPFVLMLFLLLSAAPFAHAEPPGAETFLADPAAEARAMAIAGQVRCTVCQSEAVRDSQASMARDMRRLIREKVQTGWSEEKILNHIRARYGDFILLRPPFQPNTWVLWLSPLVFILAAGGGVCWFFLRNLGRRS